MGIAPIASITLFVNLIISSSDKRFADNQAANDKRFADNQAANDKRFADNMMASEKRFTDNQAAADKRFSDLLVSFKEIKIEESKNSDLKFFMKSDKIPSTTNSEEAK